MGSKVELVTVEYFGIKEDVRRYGTIGTLLRGTEWAATGKVTIPLPKDFPTADKVSQMPAK